MTDDKLSFLNEKPADETEVKENVDTTPSQTQSETPAAPQQEAEQAPVTEQQQPQQREDYNPLLPKYLDTYNKLRDAEKRLAEYEEKQKVKVETPDPLLDPEGYAAHQQRVWDEKLWDNTAITSEIAARRYYGTDVVQAAFEALKAQADPLVGMRIRQSPDPWDTIVKWHQRELLLQEIGDNPDEWAVRNGYVRPAPIAEGQPPPVPQQQAAPVIPASSLSRAPASKKASDVAVGPGQAFDGAFASR